MWPFRGQWHSKWVSGALVTLFLPLLFIPLLGYAIAATRAAEQDPPSGPPAWDLSARLLSDGLWTSLAVLVSVIPFGLVFNPLANLLFGARVWSSGDPFLAQLHAHVLALLILALPWGLLVLLLMPRAAAAFAANGNPGDLFNYPAALRAVADNFATWNLAVAAIVTGWAVGIACAGLLCVGIVPGIFYAILVSAHASATLHPKGSPLTAR